MTDTTLNRRRILAAGTATLASPLAAVPALAAVTTGPHPDALLLALGRDLDVAWATERETFAAFAGVDTPEADDLTDAASDATSAIVAEIEQLSATTLAGLAVKAKAVSWCHSGEPIGPDSMNEQATTDVRLASSMVRDLLQLGGEAANV